MSDTKSLEECDSSNTPWLTLEGIETQCKIIEVYDADTVTVVIPFNGKKYKMKCRLIGIDTAEKRTKNLEEKKIGLLGQKWLSDKIKDTILWIKCSDWDKYGRLLGTLYLTKSDLDNDLSLNSILVSHGFGYFYDGKKKKKFEEWFNGIKTP